ncbi:hypothetical protein D3C71_267280 [compost metagenome]
MSAAGAFADFAFASASSASSRSARALTLSATRRARDDLSVRLMLSMLGEPVVVYPARCHFFWLTSPS